MKWNDLINVSKEPNNFEELLNYDNNAEDNLKKLLKFLIEMVNNRIQDKYLINIKKPSPLMLGQVAFIPKGLKVTAKSRNLLLVSCYSNHLYIRAFGGNIYKIIYRDNQFVLERLRSMNVYDRNLNTSCNKTVGEYETFIDEIEKQYKILTSGKKRGNRIKPKVHTEIESKKIFEGNLELNPTLKFKGEIKPSNTNDLKITSDLLKLSGIGFIKIQVCIIEDMIVIKSLNNKCFICNKETQNIQGNICICENCYIQLYSQKMLLRKNLLSLSIPQVCKINRENNLIICTRFLEILKIDKNTTLEIYIFENCIIIRKAH